MFTLAFEVISKILEPKIFISQTRQCRAVGIGGYERRLDFAYEVLDSLGLVFTLDDKSKCI